MTAVSAQQGNPIRQVSPEAVAALREVFRGELVGAGDPGYDTARRVWNGNIDRRPALIARCLGLPTCSRRSAFARDGGPAGVGARRRPQRPRLRHERRRPGHRPVGDEGHPRRPGGPHGRAQGGVLWRELDRETQAFGLATTGGTVSNTGIAGLTLGGGLGWLMGKHGLTVDNLLSADVVTADGAVPHGRAPTREPDLFWALRGGGGNFGVVTSFEYQLHPVDQVLGGLVALPARPGARRAALLPRVLPHAARRGRGLPRRAHRSPGRHARGRAAPRLQRPTRGGRAGPRPGPPVRPAARRPRRPDAVRRPPDACSTSPNAIHGLHRYWRSAFTEQHLRRAHRRVVEAAASFSSPLSALLFFYMHGAATRVPADATAFAARRPSGTSTPSASGPTPAESDGHIALGARRLGSSSSRTSRAAATSTTSPPTTARRRSAPPTAPTTPGCAELKSQVRPDQPVPDQPQHHARPEPRSRMTPLLLPHRE